MTKNLTVLVLYVCVVSSVATVAVACSSSEDGGAADAAAGANTGSAAAWAAGNCAQVGSTTCANDDPTTQSSRDTCEAKRTDAKCSAPYVAYLKCLGQHVSCNADGKVDTAKLVGPCTNEIVPHELCIIRTTFDAGVLDAGGG